MDDPPEPARDFVAEYGATWPTVDDPDEAIKTAYRVAARPQTYFIDGDGILRSIQIGELPDADFERQYALIAGRDAAPAGPSAADRGRRPRKRYGGRTVARRRRPRRSGRGELVALLGPERRRQDDDGRDRRGLPAPRRGHGPGARRGPARGGPALAGAGRADAPGRRRSTRGATARDAPAVRRVPRRRRATRTSCSTWSGSRRRRARRASGACPAASASGSRWRSRSSGDPRSLILDEPTAGMDPEARAATRELIAGLRTDGVGDPADDPRPRRRRAPGRPRRVLVGGPGRRRRPRRRTVRGGAAATLEDAYLAARPGAVVSRAGAGGPGDPRPGRRGAAPDGAPRREPAGHRRHPGRRPRLLRDDLDPRPCPGRAPSTPCCRAPSPWPSSRPGSSTSGSRPPTSGAMACSSGSAARRSAGPGLVGAKILAVAVIEVAPGRRARRRSRRSSSAGGRRRRASPGPGRRSPWRWAPPTFAGPGPAAGRHPPRRGDALPSRTACSSRPCCSAASSSRPSDLPGAAGSVRRCCRRRR